jgi:protein-tyrosine-phosphatase
VPHGAAKSVLAPAYFQREAKARGLNVRVVSAGTDPDAQVSPAVASHLKKNGCEVLVAKPRRATADDMKQADVVISNRVR